MYTRAYVSFAPHASVYANTPRERRDWGLFVQMYLGGIRTLPDARNYFSKERDYVGVWLFTGQYYRDLCGSYGCFPDSVLRELEDGYTAFLSHSFESEMFRYRLDLVLWDQEGHPEWHLEQYSFLRKVWEGEGMSLWERAI